MNLRTKQAVFSTIISYLGVVAGFLTSAILIPAYLAPAQVGLVKLITATVGIFASIFSLGVHQMLYRSYSQYASSPKKQGNLFFVAIKFTLVGVLLALPVYLLLYTDMLNIDKETLSFSKSGLFVISVFVAISFRIVYNAIFSYVRMKGKVIIDSVIQNIVLKVGVLVLIVFYILNVISFSTFIYAHIAIYLFFPLLGLIYMSYMGYTPKWGKVNYEKSERKELYRLSIFGSLAAIGGSLYLFLDTFMVNHFLDESDVGIYGTMFLFGIIVNIPARNLRNASVSIISEYVANGERTKLGRLYRKSSNHLLLIGGYLFLGVITNLEVVYSFLPNEYSDTFFIIFFIGIAQLIDMLTSINIEIIASSKYYRLNTYFVFISIFVAILFNWIFIPIYGIEGAALGTLLAVLVNNTLRTIAVGRIFGIYPINTGTLKSILIISVCYSLMLFIPNLENRFVDFLVRGSIITAVYLPLTYAFRISEDINLKINKVIGKKK